MGDQDYSSSEPLSPEVSPGSHENPEKPPHLIVNLPRNNGQRSTFMDYNPKKKLSGNFLRIQIKCLMKG
jgi:hypothetical protein